LSSVQTIGSKTGLNLCSHIECSEEILMRKAKRNKEVLYLETNNKEEKFSSSCIAGNLKWIIN